MKPFIKLILMIRLRRTGCNSMQGKPDLKDKPYRKHNSIPRHALFLPCISVFFPSEHNAERMWYSNGMINT